jgi:DNA-binding transcriptional MocR family regulator
MMAGCRDPCPPSPRSSRTSAPPRSATSSSSPSATSHLLRGRAAGTGALPGRAHRRRLRDRAGADRRRPRTAVLLDRRGPAAARAAGAAPALRGLPAGAGEILVTTGSQQALGLVASVLPDPGDNVLVENPSYLAALQTFSFAGARLVPVHCDDDGIDPQALPELIARHAPKFLYLVPTFQNPTGRTLPAERRRRLAEIAAEHGLWLVEDDPYGELRYDGEPLRPIAAQPRAGDRTVTVSSLSKVLAPGLRIGWLRAPETLLRALAVAKQPADLRTSTIDQLVLRRRRRPAHAAPVVHDARAGADRRGPRAAVGRGARVSYVGDCWWKASLQAPSRRTNVLLMTAE